MALLKELYLETTAVLVFLFFCKKESSRTGVERSGKREVWAHGGPWDLVTGFIRLHVPLG